MLVIFLLRIFLCPWFFNSSGKRGNPLRLSLSLVAPTDFHLPPAHILPPNQPFHRSVMGMLAQSSPGKQAKEQHCITTLKNWEVAHAEKGRKTDKRGVIEINKHWNDLPASNHCAK
jgi:hypothetical protein